jgi:UDP-2,3-diacylglucosamine pyrophosphatase LpxH
MRRIQGWSDRPVRSVFLSDVHLGSRHSQCHQLLDFLGSLQPSHLYIVGDLIDGWQLKRSFHWTPAYGQLFELIATMAANGTRVFYVPGNHDAFVIRDSLARQFFRQLDFVEVASEFIHRVADGRRLLVTHGDQFDFVEQSAHWLSVAVQGLYDTSLSANRLFSRLCRVSHQSPYRFCARVEDWIKSLIRLLRRFEDSLLEYARERGCQGVICGHLHTPAIIQRDGMTYCNTGDWVENCTALLEYEDASLQLASYYPHSVSSNAVSADSQPTSATTGQGDQPGASLHNMTFNSIVRGGPSG